MLAPECEFYLCSGCLITIFHHVKQIEDNEGLGDGGASLCAAYKEINLFPVRYKGLLLERPLIGYALEIDGVPLLPHGAKHPRRTGEHHAGSTLFVWGGLWKFCCM